VVAVRVPEFGGSHGALGDIDRETRGIAGSSGQGPAIYATRYQYDTWVGYSSSSIPMVRCSRFQRFVIISAVYVDPWAHARTTGGAPNHARPFGHGRVRDKVRA
jgi:hypothetical protein